MGRYKYIDENKEHLHTLDGKPLIGTSTATKIIAKPLTWWASGMAVAKFGWVNPKKATPEFVKQSLDEGYSRVTGLSKEDYAKLLTQAYRAHNDRKEQAAEEGTDRHKILEEYVKTCIENNNGVPVDESNPEIIRFVQFAKYNISKFLWSEINGYSEVLWTGGIADVGWIDKQDRIIAGDFKSGGPYFDQFVQIGGYDLMLSENGGLTKDGDKVFDLPGKITGYCVLPFATKEFNPRFEYNVESYRQGFRAAVALHKLSHEYESYD